MRKEELETWPRLETKVLLDEERCRILEDRVRLPSGRAASWWRFADGPDAVCVICLDQERRVLVAYQYNNAPQRVVDEFPGGGAGPAEPGLEAARRELLEETGLYAHALVEIGAFLVNNRRSAQRMRVFVATDLTQLVAQPEEGEHVAWEWLAVDEVERRIRAGELESGYLLAAWSLFRLSGM